MKYLIKFTKWFNNKFAWFFTNGYKQINKNNKNERSN